MEELLQNYLSVWQDLNPHLAKLFFQDTIDEIHGTLFEPKVKVDVKRGRPANSCASPEFT